MMSNLSQETEAARRLIEQVRADYPDDDDLLHDMVEGSTDVFEICDWIAGKIGMDEASQNAIKEYQQSLGERRDRLARRVEANKKRLRETMDILGLKKLELPCATLSMRVGKPKLVIDDEEEIPVNYWHEKVTTYLDKNQLASDLARETIDGAHLSNAEPSLTIRRK